MDQKAITVKRVGWSPMAAAALENSVRRAPCFTVDDYKRLVEGDPINTGLYRVSQGERFAGFVILRVEHFAGGAEGVILAASGSAEGTDLTSALMPHLESMFKGIKCFRVDTARRGLVKKLAAQGYEVTHYVLRKPAQ